MIYVVIYLGYWKASTQAPGYSISITYMIIHLCYGEAVFIYDHSHMGLTSQMTNDRSVIDTAEFPHG